jgi:hypothetical protein
MRSVISMSTLALTLVCTMAVTAGCSSDAGLKTDGGGGAGGGGAAGAGGSATVNCDAISDPIDPTALIDDMETPDSQAAMQGGRNGSWWAGGDAESVGASIKPNGAVDAEAIPGGRCGSAYGVRVTGHGFTQWAVLTVSMGWGSVDGGADDLLPFDATGRKGITFWARIGDTSTDSVRVALSDKYSQPLGGFCVDGPTSTIDDACFDLFTVTLTQLSTTWKPYRIPFNGLAQRNFGLKRPALDVSSIYTIEFAPALSTTFDFWVDDINFY